MFSDFRIETERLLLRAFTMEDVSGFLKVVSQPEVMESLPEGVMSEEQLRKTLRRIVDCYEKNMPKKIVKLSVAVVDKRSKRIIGWVGLAPLECSPSEIEIYYGLSAHHWGKGLATESARAMLHFGFRTVGLDRIVAVVTPENLASQRVVEKLGMRFGKVVEKVPPGSEFYKGLLYYSLTNAEYLQLLHKR